MKFIIVTMVCLAVSAMAIPADQPAAKDYHNIKIVSQENTQEENGKYHYSFENDDGTKAVQDGELKQVDKDNAGESVRGAFSYKDIDGHEYSITYTADENGYQPVGDHIPKIPAEILKSIEYLKTAKPYVDPSENKQ